LSGGSLAPPTLLEESQLLTKFVFGPPPAESEETIIVARVAIFGFVSVTPGPGVAVMALVISTGPVSDKSDSTKVDSPEPIKVGSSPL
jgi:hypothetical protein